MQLKRFSPPSACRARGEESPAPIAPDRGRSRASNASRRERLGDVRGLDSRGGLLCRSLLVAWRAPAL
jgi:hypothetical protein